jgi:hypothetical protein
MARQIRAIASLLALLGAAPLLAEFRTLAGEVVDVRCHRKSAENAGQAHQDCAISCARRGGLLGVRTPDGVYVITGDFTARLNARLLPFVGREVEVEGEVTVSGERRIVKARDVRLKASGHP